MSRASERIEARRDATQVIAFASSALASGLATPREQAIETADALTAALALHGLLATRTTYGRAWEVEADLTETPRGREHLVWLSLASYRDGRITTDECEAAHALDPAEAISVARALVAHPDDLHPDEVDAVERMIAAARADGILTTSAIATTEAA